MRFVHWRLDYEPSKIIAINSMQIICLPSGIFLFFLSLFGFLFVVFLVNFGVLMVSKSHCPWHLNFILDLGFDMGLEDDSNNHIH